MFTHSDVQAAWNARKPSVRAQTLKVLEYDHRVIFDGHGEDVIQFFSATRSAFESALEFWLAILDHDVDDCFPDLERYWTRGSVKDRPVHLYESELRQFLQYLRVPLPEQLLFVGQPTFVLQIRLDYCDDVVLATFDDRYVAVRSFTTA